MKHWPISLRQTGILVLAVFFFFVVMKFNARLEELERLTERAEQARGQATQLVQTQTALFARLEYATSTQAVIDTAYTSNHQAQEGDHIVIPMSVPGSPPIESELPTPVPTPMENWEIWQELFFGN